MPNTPNYPGRRAVRITARTVHLGAVIIIVGGAFWEHEPSADWLAVLVLSGGIIMADDLYRRGEAYFRWVQFWGIALKLAAVGVGVAYPPLLLPSLAVAVILGSVVSHVPGSVRHRALWGENGPSEQGDGSGRGRKRREQAARRAGKGDRP